MQTLARYLLPNPASAAQFAHDAISASQFGISLYQVFLIGKYSVQRDPKIFRMHVKIECISLKSMTRSQAAACCQPGCASGEQVCMCRTAFDEVACVQAKPFPHPWLMPLPLHQAGKVGDHCLKLYIKLSPCSSIMKMEACYYEDESNQAQIASRTPQFNLELHIFSSISYICFRNEFGSKLGDTSLTSCIIIICI